MGSSTPLLNQMSSSVGGKEITANGLFDALSPASLFGRHDTTTAALTWGWYGGTMLVDGALTAIANGTIALTASVINYLEADRAGTVSVNSTGFTAGKIPLYAIVTGTATVTSYTDYRVTQTQPMGIAVVVGAATDITLTAEQSRAKLIKVTGTLTANISLIVPDLLKEWIVVNSTSGGFTLTVKTAAGTGLAVTAGTNRLVLCDGTNVIALTV